MLVLGILYHEPKSKDLTTSGKNSVAVCVIPDPDLNKDLKEMVE